MKRRLLKSYPPSQKTTPACRNAALRRAGTGLPVDAQQQKLVRSRLRRKCEETVASADVAEGQAKNLSAPACRQGRDNPTKPKAKALWRSRVFRGTTGLPVGLHLFGVVLAINFIGCATQAPVYKPPEAFMQPGIYHKVTPGETLWRISQIYNVDLDALVSVNRIPDAAKIEKGQMIFIPGATSLKSKEPQRVYPGEANFIWPVEGKVIRYFGGRFNDKLNKGLDIQVKARKEVLASRSGRVSFADFLRGYGKTVIIEHPDGLSTVYAYNSEILVKPRDAVSKGMAIARCNNNNSGYLHFEIRRGSKAQNPLFYLP